jgi:hypothetical protein
MMYVIAGVFTLFMVLVFGLVFNPPTKWAHKMTGDEEARELEDNETDKKA